MEINGKDLSMPMDAYVRQTRDGAQNGRGLQQSGQAGEAVRDRVSLSDGVEWVRALAARTASLPQTDEDRVAALRARIDAGNYRIDSEKIADRMLRDSILDELA
jgi:negative regulator of flagellin synthesis FlgM